MANTLKFGNGTWATKKGSTLAYNDEDGNFKPLPFTYTGAGKGTRVNKEGLIEVVENDRPRIDYTDSEDGVFLLEKASTNLVTHSEDFTQWNIQSGTTVTSNTTDTLSPSGEYDASKVVGSGTSGILKSSVSSSGGTNTKSIYLKGISGGEQVKLKDPNQTVNQKTLTLTTQWQRYTLTESQTSSFGIWIDDIPTSGIYMWGAQVETGNLSSYIPTQGTIQTRVAETASGSGNSEVFNSEQGVLFANIAANANNGTNRKIVLGDGSYNNGIEFGYQTTTNKMQFIIRSGGSISMNIETIYFDVTKFSKALISYKSNQGKVFVNGFQVGTTDTSVVTPIGINQLDLKFSSSFDFEGKTKEIAYYDTVLTDLELETLTSYRTWEAMVKELNLNIIHNE